MNNKDMSMRSSFIISDDPPIKVSVEFTLDRQEKYWVNDKLVKEINAIGGGSSNVRKFMAEGHEIEISYSFKSGERFSRAYVDGKLAVEELFEEIEFLSKNKHHIYYSIRKVVFFLIGSILILIAYILFK